MSTRGSTAPIAAEADAPPAVRRPLAEFAALAELSRTSAPLPATAGAYADAHDCDSEPSAWFQSSI